MDDAAQPIGLFETMATCRAMRRLRPDPVPDSLLRQLVEAATFAASGRNLQRSRWIIVRDTEQRRRLAALNRRASEESARAMSQTAPALPHHDEAKRRRMWESVLWLSEHMHEVPAIIVACCILDTSEEHPNRYASSVWPGIQNLRLAARGLGLGAAPTTYALRYRDELNDVLEVPERVAVQALIPVGYPFGKFGPVSRLPVDSVMMDDRWTGEVPAPTA